TRLPDELPRSCPSQFQSPLPSRRRPSPGAGVRTRGRAGRDDRKGREAMTITHRAQRRRGASLGLVVLAAAGRLSIAGGPAPVTETATMAGADAGHAIFLTAPRDDFDTTATAGEQEVLSRHFAHLKRQFEAGHVILAGPTMGQPPVGLVVVRGEEAVARRIMEEDPAVVEGVFTAELRPMRLALLQGGGIDTSRHEAEPTDRQVLCEQTVGATPAECWAKWTTSEGIATFLVPTSTIELRIGGLYEMYFLADAPAGQRGSDGCR